MSGSRAKYGGAGVNKMVLAGQTPPVTGRDWDGDGDGQGGGRGV